MQVAGFFTNCAAYPAVPDNGAGLRIELTTHLRMEDIDALVQALVELRVPRVDFTAEISSPERVQVD